MELERELREKLGANRLLGKRLLWLPEVDSTNDFLKRGEDLPDGTVVLAERQSAGRGRRGRSFESAGGKGVYLSVLLRPQLPPGQLLPLTGLCAEAMCAAVERAAFVRPQIKWTNDLILQGRKLAGILVEPLIQAGALSCVIIGVGVNVSQTEEDFGSEVGKLATSLKIATGREISRITLAAAMIEELEALYEALLRGETADYVQAYRRDCLTLGREVQLLWQDVHERVHALDVDENFGLIVRRADGSVETIRTGEVSVRGLYGYVE